MDSEVAQLVKVFATKPDDLSCIPGTYMGKGESWLPHCPLTTTNVLRHRPAPTPGNINKCEVKNEAAGQSSIVSLSLFSL